MSSCAGGPTAPASFQPGTPGAPREINLIASDYAFVPAVVRVVPGEVFGPSGAGYVRLSVAGDPGRLREGLNRLGEFVAELRGEKPQPASLAAAA